MNVNYITRFPMSDIHSLSGMNFYIAKALKEQGIELTYTDALHDQLKYFFYFKKLFYKSFGKNYLIDRTPIIIQDYAKQV